MNRRVAYLSPAALPASFPRLRADTTPRGLLVVRLAQHSSLPPRDLFFARSRHRVVLLRQQPHSVAPAHPGLFVLAVVFPRCKGEVTLSVRQFS